MLLVNTISFSGFVFPGVLYDCINSLPTSLTVLLWPIHDHSHKYLYQLAPTCEQNPIDKKATLWYLRRKKNTWNQSGRLQSLNVLDKLVPGSPFTRQNVRLSSLSLFQKPSWRRLNTLGQKQYLGRDVGEKFLMNKLISEWNCLDCPLYSWND